jgi:6-phosphofructokinase
MLVPPRPFGAGSPFFSALFMRVCHLQAYHHRVMVLEVMGRNVGWIAFEAGLAGGADVVLIPEIPFGYQAIAAGILNRARRSRRFSIVVLSAQVVVPWFDRWSRTVLIPCGSAACVSCWHGSSRPSCRSRCGTWCWGTSSGAAHPPPFDRVLATRFGTGAVSALADGESGSMVALRGARIERVSMANVLSKPKRVDPQGERVTTARSIG